MISLSEECNAKCGSRLVQINSTAMNERLTFGCTILVLRRLPVLELDLFLGNGGVRYVALACAGLPAPVAPMLMLVARQHMSLCWSLEEFTFPLILVVLLLPLVLPWSLGWCSVPLVRHLLPKEVGLTRLPGCLGWISFSWLQGPSSWAGVGFSPPGPHPYPPQGKEHMASPTSDSGPSLGPSQAALMNALALLSNVWGTCTA